MSRFMGLDYGLERVGVAFGDPATRFAAPHGFLPAKPFRKLVGMLKVLIRQQEISLIVIGIPRNMDGSYGPAADAAREFARRLGEALVMPIETFDERLTTVQAARGLREAGKSARQQKESIDAASAAIILQSFLDSRSLQ